MERSTITILVVALLAIILTIAIFFVSVTRESAPTESEQDQTEITYPTQTPEEVVRGFYEWYRKEDSEKNFRENEALDSTLVERIETLVAKDGNAHTLFYCQKESPAEIVVGTSAISKTSADVSAEAVFSEAEELAFIVNLNLASGAWRIHDVTCFAKG